MLKGSWHWNQTLVKISFKMVRSPEIFFFCIIFKVLQKNQKEEQDHEQEQEQMYVPGTGNLPPIVTVAAAVNTHKTGTVTETGILTETIKET